MPEREPLNRGVQRGAGEGGGIPKKMLKLSKSFLIESRIKIKRETRRQTIITIIIIMIMMIIMIRRVDGRLVVVVVTVVDLL